MDVPELPEIAEVKRMEIRPGDRLVVRLDVPEVDMYTAEKVAEQVAAILRTDAPVLVMPAGADIEVIGPDSEAAETPVSVKIDELAAGDAEEFFRWLKDQVRRRGGPGRVFALWARFSASC